VRVDVSGLVEGVRYLLSPNWDERPPGTRIELIVVHAISLPPGEFGGHAIDQLFMNTLNTAAHPYYATLVGLRVSAHFVIRRTGELTQFVPCVRRAWHAGLSQWRGRVACNDFSVGIELEGCDDQPFEPVQYSLLAELTKALEAAYPIADIVGHSHIAPGRKTDPGPHFDWALYRGLIART
jgi:AmpD protein